MIVFRDPNYIVNGDLTSDFDGPWIHCSTFESISAQVVVTSSGVARAGYLMFQGTNDPARTEVITVAGGARVVASALDTIYLFSNLPEWIRASWRTDPGGGGGPNELTHVRVIGRS